MLSVLAFQIDSIYLYPLVGLRGHFQIDKKEKSKRATRHFIPGRATLLKGFFLPSLTFL